MPRRRYGGARWALASAMLLAAPTSVFAEEPRAEPPVEKKPDTVFRKEDIAKLAKAARNPIANLFSVPVEVNVEGGMGPHERTAVTIDLEPVIPIELAPWATLVTRWSLPLVGQPHVDAPSGSTWGLGDFNPQFYFAFQLPHGFSLGPGMTVVIPTGTDPRLGQGKLSLGPALVATWSGGPVLVGTSIRNAWSVAGADERDDVDAMVLQPFAVVNVPLGFYLTTAPQMLFDWKHSDWTVPVGGGAGHLVVLGVQRVNVGVEAYWNALRAEGGASWVARAQMQVLFPMPKEK